MRKKDEKNYFAVHDIIEKKFGLFKQLAVRIDHYQLLLATHNLTIALATKIIKGIMDDTKELDYFMYITVDKLAKVAIDNTPDKKITLWGTLLITLKEEIERSVNDQAKKYFEHYVKIIEKESGMDFGAAKKSVG